MGLTETTIIRLEETGFDLTALKQLFQEHSDFNDSIGSPLNTPCFKDELEQLPNKYAPIHRGQLYLAKIDGEFVGCAGLYQFSESIAEVKRVYVQTQYRGKGIGRALMEAVIADAKALGYQQLYLDSLERMTNAKALYPKFGFKRIAPFNDDPEPDVYYMGLDLT
ncbi:MAG: GNAT family N-acetyltransferase [Candidatus Melainabacteria bacterium]|nr:GNAT family N-acetyltransferase [Candidatus Melainabacteria bacterium]